MTNPKIPVSWGELLDKIAILEIKTHRLRGTQARANVAKELGMLRRAASPIVSPAGVPNVSGVPELEAALRAVNTRLWRIEDLIREQETKGEFGPDFVALARSVYHENDERARIKHALNRLLRSALVEEKQYLAYETTTSRGGDAGSA
jgi:hypothetical protein